MMGKPAKLASPYLYLSEIVPTKPIPKFIGQTKQHDPCVLSLFILGKLHRCWAINDVFYLTYVDYRKHEAITYISTEFKHLPYKS